MMDQNEKKEWEQRLHSHCFSGKIPSFFHLLQCFAEEMAAFAEYLPAVGIYGLIIGYRPEA